MLWEKSATITSREACARFSNQCWSDWTPVSPHVNLLDETAHRRAEIALDHLLSDYSNQGHEWVLKLLKVLCVKRECVSIHKWWLNVCCLLTSKYKDMRVSGLNKNDTLTVSDMKHHNLMACTVCRLNWLHRLNRFHPLQSHSVSLIRLDWNI